MVQLRLHACQEGDILYRVAVGMYFLFIVIKQNKEENQTHAVVYTLCCSTPDQHQESTNNTITQKGEKESSMTEHPEDQ